MRLNADRVKRCKVKRGVAEFFGSGMNNSAALSHCPAMSRLRWGYEPRKLLFLHINLIPPCPDDEPQSVSKRQKNFALPALRCQL